MALQVPGNSYEVASISDKVRAMMVIFCTSQQWSPDQCGQWWLYFVPFHNSLVTPINQPCNAINSNRLSFCCPVMMVTENLEVDFKKLDSGPKTVFFAPKRNIWQFWPENGPLSSQMTTCRKSEVREAINCEKKDFLWNHFVNGGGVWLISYLYFIFPNTLQTHFKHPATPFKHP